jgi:hypothetical protein
MGIDYPDPAIAFSCGSTREKGKDGTWFDTIFFDKLNS